MRQPQQDAQLCPVPPENGHPHRRTDTLNASRLYSPKTSYTTQDFLTETQIKMTSPSEIVVQGAIIGFLIVMLLESGLPLPLSWY